MKLNVILFCVLLFCSRIVVALPHAEDLPRHGAYRPSSWPVHQNAPEYHNTDFAQTHKNALLNSAHQNTDAQEFYPNQVRKGYEGFGYNNNPSAYGSNVNAALENYGSASDRSFLPRVPNTNGYPKKSFVPRTDDDFQGSFDKLNYKNSNRQIQQVNPVIDEATVTGNQIPSLTSVQEPYQSQGSYPSMKSPLSNHQFYQPEQFYQQAPVTGARRKIFNGNYGPVSAPGVPIPYENHGDTHSLIPDLRGRSPGNNGYTNNFARPHEFNNPRPFQIYDSAPVLNQPQTSASYGHHYRAGHPIPNINYNEGPSVLEATLTRDFRNRGIGNSYGPHPDTLNKIPITNYNDGSPTDVLSQIPANPDNNDQSDLSNIPAADSNSEDNNGSDNAAIGNNDLPAFDVTGNERNNVVDTGSNNTEPFKDVGNDAAPLINDFRHGNKNNIVGSGSSTSYGDDEETPVPSTNENPDDFDSNKFETKDDTQNGPNKPDISSVLNYNNQNQNIPNRRFSGVDRYDFKDITKDTEMRNTLSPNKQRYKVVFKNGTVQYVDDLESIQQYYPNHKFIGKKTVTSDGNNVDALDDVKTPLNQNGPPTDSQPETDNKNRPLPIDLNKSSIPSTTVSSSITDLSSTIPRAPTIPNDNQSPPKTTTILPGDLLSTPSNNDSNDSIITLSPIETPADNESDFNLATTEAGSTIRKKNKKSTTSTADSLDDEEVNKDVESSTTLTGRFGRKKSKKSATAPTSSTNDEDTESTTTPADYIGRKNPKILSETPSSSTNEEDTKSTTTPADYIGRKKSKIPSKTSSSSANDKDMESSTTTADLVGRKMPKKSSTTPSSSAIEEDIESYTISADRFNKKKMKTTSTTPSSNGSDEGTETSTKNPSSGANTENTESSSTAASGADHKKPTTPASTSSSEQYTKSSTTASSDATSKNPKKSSTPTVVDQDVVSTTVSPISSVTNKNKRKADKSKTTPAQKDNGNGPSSATATYNSLTDTDDTANRDDNSPTTVPSVENVNTADNSSTDGVSLDSQESVTDVKVSIDTHSDNEGDTLTITVEVSSPDDDNDDNFTISFDGKDTGKAVSAKTKDDAPCSMNQQKNNKKDKKKQNTDDAQAGKNFQIDLSNIKDKPSIWFRTTDQSFYDKILADDDSPCSVVYFFEMESKPVVEREVNTTIYPDGTIVVDTTETRWENKDDPSPKIIKSTKVIPAEDKS